MTPIRVNINSGNHSSGRGVGFYADNLKKYLSKNPDIILTDNRPDLVHYPFFDIFYPTLPLYKPVPTVVTIHDLTPLILKDLYPKGIKGSLGLIRQRLSLMNTKAIITDSNNSKRDIIQLFKVNRKSVYPIYLGVDELYFKNIPEKTLKEIKTKYHLPDTFILTVAGGPNPNKNLPMLAEITKKLNLKLVIVGRGLLQDIPAGDIHPELADLQRLKQYKHLILPGFVPTEDLSAIYRLASLYCQPSLYEGFGIPVLEAMASGCLLASSNTSSLPEIYHSDTISFNPSSHESMTAAITRSLSLSKEEKKFLIDENKLRAHDFSWEKTAVDTLGLYKKIIDEA